MIQAVADSGPCIHLGIINHTALLHKYFEPLLTIRQVYDEVVTEGRGRPGAQELMEAYERGHIRIIEITDPSAIDRIRRAQRETMQLSEVDIMVLALAMEHEATVLSDDRSVRTLATTLAIPVVGSIGILIQAKLEGVVQELKPLLDKLITAGFHLDPHGPVYRDALRSVGEA